MKKKLCKTLRTMANKLPDEKYTVVTSAHERDVMRRTIVPVNHYRRLKRLLVKGGTQAVKIYYDKHKIA